MSNPDTTPDFIEELIQLQVKHNILLEGYEVTFWTKSDGETAEQYHKDKQYLVSEEKIRDRWEWVLTRNGYDKTETGFVKRPPVSE
jgi:hypothetical protein